MVGMCSSKLVELLNVVWIIIVFLMVLLERIFCVVMLWLFSLLIVCVDWWVIFSYIVCLDGVSVECGSVRFSVFVIICEVFVVLRN